MNSFTPKEWTQNSISSMEVWGLEFSTPFSQDESVYK